MQSMNGQGDLVTRGKPSHAYFPLQFAMSHARLTFEILASALMSGAFAFGAHPIAAVG